MGIIGRFADIMSANINAILSKLENDNAEELLEKYLRDAKQNLNQVKAEASTIIAQEKSAQRKLTECEKEIEKFGNYVVAALKAGNDADAKKFLVYKNELEAKQLNLQKDYIAAKENSEKMRQMTNKLTSDVQTAENKLQEMKTKILMAKQQEKMNEMNQKLNTNQLESFDNMMDKIQKRIDAAEARAELEKSSVPGSDIADLAAKYDESGKKVSDTSVDDELLKLKAELGLL